MKNLLRKYLLSLVDEEGRGNCVVYAITVWLVERNVVLHVRRSPDFPLLPRVSFSFGTSKNKYRFQHVGPVRKDGWRRWLPLHAIWFKGVVRRDFT